MIDLKHSKKGTNSVQHANDSAHGALSHLIPILQFSIFVSQKWYSLMSIKISHFIYTFFGIECSIFNQRFSQLIHYFG